MKKCNKCNELKNLSDFSRNGTGTICKLCTNLYAKELRQRNLEQFRQKDKERYYRNHTKRLEAAKEYNSQNRDRIAQDNKARRLANPEQHDKIQRRSYLKRYYGISLEIYELLLKQQDSKCLICGVHQDNLKKKLSVDHDHNTGEIRGLLCSHCNLGIGHFKDNTELLLKAIKYLKNTTNNI